MNHMVDRTDALTEVVNIGVGRAAASLSDLIGTRIELTVPKVTRIRFGDLSERVSSDLDTAIIQGFVGAISGRAALAFPEASALTLGQILADLDDTPAELDFDLQDVLNEVGNIVLNGVLGTLSNLIHGSLQYTVPVLTIETNIEHLAARHLGEIPDDQQVVIADAWFEVAERNISGSLVLLFDVGGIETITDSFCEGV